MKLLIATFVLLAWLIFPPLASTQSLSLPRVKPGNLITPDNATAVADLVSPGNFKLVEQGMQMRVIASGRLEWPPPYKTATEKYSPQVGLTSDGYISLNR